MSSIAELIHQHVSLGKVSSTGFHQLKCPICHDYKSRMGIKFSNENIGANCFNCGFSTRHKEHQRVSKKFKKLLLALGIDEDEIKKISAQGFFNPQEPEVISSASLIKINLFTSETKLPMLSVRITKDNFPDINEYLAERKIDLEDYPFYASVDKKYKDRVIIPFYKHGGLIYWQARSITGSKLRYLNCEMSKEAVMFNMDELYKKSSNPLYITEGVFDAIGVHGVAVIGSKLNPAKIELLRQSRRDLVFVIDSDNNGVQLCESVLQYNLGSITRLSKGLDVNKSVMNYGRFWTFYQLVQNTCRTDFEKKLMLNNLKAGL